MKTLSKIWDYFILIFAIIPEKTSEKFNFNEYEDFMRGPKR